MGITTVGVAVGVGITTVGVAVGVRESVTVGVGEAIAATVTSSWFDHELSPTALLARTW